MSQENVELAYRAFDALNRRELDAFLALMDDDIEVVPRVSAIEGESGYRGHDGVRRWWSSMLDVFPDYSMEVVEMRDLGDLTFATFHARGHGAGSAAPTDNAAWIVARWRRGKVVLVEHFQRAGRGSRSRGAVGARRSRRPLSLRDTARAMSQENVEIVQGLAAFIEV